MLGIERMNVECMNGHRYSLACSLEDGGPSARGTEEGRGSESAWLCCFLGKSFLTAVCWSKHTPSWSPYKYTNSLRQVSGASAVACGAVVMDFESLSRPCYPGNSGNPAKWVSPEALQRRMMGGVLFHLVVAK